jgi:pimeloyl-ACP methyl ester carboxylesterase
VLGFGALARRRLSAEETWPWVAAYLSDAGVRRDVAAFARAWTGDELAGSPRWLAAYRGPVLVCWAPGDHFFELALAHRMQQVFQDVRLVELPGARTFVPLDEPARLSAEIADWLAPAP